MNFDVNTFYPFGMLMPGRSFSIENYRFGYQNQEKDDEIKGDFNSVSFKYRIYDPRLGKFLSLDPLQYNFPWNSPYAFSENRVIDAVELEGREKYQVNRTKSQTSTTTHVTETERADGSNAEINYTSTKIWPGETNFRKEQFSNPDPEITNLVVVSQESRNIVEQDRTLFTPINLNTLENSSTQVVNAISSIVNNAPSTLGTTTTTQSMTSNNQPTKYEDGNVTVNRTTTVMQTVVAENIQLQVTINCTQLTPYISRIRTKLLSEGINPNINISEVVAGNMDQTGPNGLNIYNIQVNLNITRGIQQTTSFSTTIDTPTFR